MHAGDAKAVPVSKQQDYAPKIPNLTSASHLSFVDKAIPECIVIKVWSNMVDASCKKLNNKYTCCTSYKNVLIKMVLL